MKEIMQKIIKTSVKVDNGFKIINYFDDNTTASVEFFMNEDIQNLKYVDTNAGEVKTISGRISDIGINFKYVSNDFNMQKDASVYSITIDASKSKKSNVVTIKTEDLLEYTNEQKPVKKVVVLPIMKANLKSTLSDGTSTSGVFTIGMHLFNTKIVKGYDVVTGDFVVDAFMYRIDSYRRARVYGIVLKNGDVEERVLFEDIKSCGSEGVIVTPEQNITDLIAPTNGGNVTGLVLPTATFDKPVEVKSKVVLTCKNENINASTGSRCSDVIADNETVILKDISGEKDADITIKGVTFTNESHINPNGASSLTLKNCKFVETVPTASKSYLIKDTKFRKADEKPMLVQFEGCYFGNNTTVSGKRMFNLFELEAKVADGSYIKNCYFAADCCTHNQINLYDIEDGATFEISGNHFERSVNAVRLGFIGDAHCNIIIKDNVYDETDADPGWAGILLVQPFNQDTTTFEHVNIILKNNKYTGGTCQEGYLFCGSKDTPITKETAPKIDTDGYFNYGF